MNNPKNVYHELVFFYSYSVKSLIELVIMLTESKVIQ